MPSKNNISLKVYDILGKEVATLVDEIKEAGTYNINFDASKLPSGIYFYRLTTKTFSQTKNGFVAMKKLCIATNNLHKREELSHLLIGTRFEIEQKFYSAKCY